MAGGSNPPPPFLKRTPSRGVGVSEKMDARPYCTVSLLFVVNKAFEKLIIDKVFGYLEKFDLVTDLVWFQGQPIYS